MAAGPTAATLSTTAVASDGTENAPATVIVSVPPAASVVPTLDVPLHWAAVPLSDEGLPGRVSQTRTGVSGL